MKATLSSIILAINVSGFCLVGNAIAQPNNPTPAAIENTRTDGGPSGDVNEAAPTTEEQPSEPEAKADTKAEAKAEGEEKAEAPDSAADQAVGLFNSIKAGEWVLALGFFAMLLGSIGRWLMGMAWEFWKSKAGGYTIAAITGVATLGAGIVSTGGFSFSLLVTAATVAFTAMGLHGPAKAAKDKAKSLIPAKT